MKKTKWIDKFGKWVYGSGTCDSEFGRFIIYGLIDNQTFEIRYVGSSSSGLYRPRQHKNPSMLKKRTHLYKWINSLIESGGDYDIVVLEQCFSVGDLAETEIYWIGLMRLAGSNLTNHTIGGEGRRGHIVSLDTRNKISAANTGKIRTPDMRSKISEIRKATGWTPPKSMIEKARLAVKGIPQSEERRRENSNRQKERWAYIDRSASSLSVKSIWNNRTPEERKAIQDRRVETMRRKAIFAGKIEAGE